jgi:predicted transposase YdaD
MKTDSIFYRIFKDFPSIFFELINNPTQSGVGYEFSSIEVKQTAFRGCFKSPILCHAERSVREARSQHLSIRPKP